MANPVFARAHTAVSWGWTSVDVFFVLSGFLITGILLDTVGKPGYFKNFYIRRVIRIWPAYITCLALVTVVAIGVVWYNGDASASLFLAQAPWYWTHATNLLNARAHDFLVTPLGTGHFWSLAVEEQFYLFWPLLILIAGRTPRRIIAVSSVLIIGVALLRVVLFRRLGVDAVALYVLMPTRADSFAWGALISGVWHLNRELVAKVAPICFVVGVLAFIALTVHVGETYAFAPAFTLAGYSAAGLASAGIVGYAATSQRATWLSHIVPRTLGKYSYAAYLWHGPILYGLEQVQMSALTFVCLAIVLTIVAAQLSWLAVEQPARLLQNLVIPQPVVELKE
jgi:peptidoglycan/LPS O-acetylase OafA/YrhL